MGKGIVNHEPSRLLNTQQAFLFSFKTPLVLSSIQEARIGKHQSAETQRHIFHNTLNAFVRFNTNLDSTFLALLQNT